MKISFSGLPTLLKSHVQILLWIFLLFILVLELFVLKSSYDLMISTNAAPTGAASQVIKVNFEQYNTIEKRLNDNAKFESPGISYPSPFNLPQATTSTPPPAQ